MPTHNRATFRFFKTLLASAAVAWILPICAVTAHADIDEEILRDFYPPARRLAATAETPAAGDGTMTFLRVVRNWNRLKPETRAKLQPWFRETKDASGARQAAVTNTTCVSGLAGVEETRASEHFLIHYTTDTSSSHKVSSTGTGNTPDYIRNMLDDAEYIRSHAVDTLGFPTAPNGPAGRYDIYVCDLIGAMGNYLGVTYTDSQSSNFVAQSHIEMDNDYANTSIRNGVTLRDFIRVILAHEYFHAIQFGMNFTYPTSWFLESTAVWIEDEVYPNVNDYVSQYLGTWFVNPTMSLDHFASGDVYAYGSGIYFRYLSEHAIGGEGVRGIWALVNDKGRSCDPNCPSNMDQISEIPQISAYLTSKGFSFATEFQRFGVANVKKDYRDGSLSYFPSIRPKTESSSYPNTESSIPLDHMESAFMRYSPPSSAAAYRMTLNLSGASAGTWAASAILERPDGLYEVRDFDVAGTSGSLTVDGMGTVFSGAVAVVSNIGGTTAADSASFSLTANMTSSCNTLQTTPALASGWNMISVPITPVSISPFTLFGAQNNEIYSYNTTSKSLLFYGQNGFKDIGSPGTGYWLYRNSAGAANPAGCAVTATQTDIDLGTGWNLIGNPFNADVDWTDAHASVIADGAAAYSLSQAETNGWLETRLFGYAASAYAAMPANSGYRMSPWAGYWIYTRRPLVLRIAR